MDLKMTAQRTSQIERENTHPPTHAPSGWRRLGEPAGIRSLTSSAAAEYDEELDRLLSDVPDGDDEPTVATVATTVQPAPQQDVPYSFDGFAEVALFAHETDASLSARLAATCQVVADKQATYVEARGIYCVINIAMNNQGLRPPQFRRFLSVPTAKKGVKYDPAMTCLSHDRKVIDLHWLFKNCPGILIDDLRFADLLCGDEFDFKRAAAFVQTRWKSEARAAILGLADVEEWQVGMIKSPAEKARWKEITTQARGVVRTLRSAAYRHQTKKIDIDDYRDLWIASEVCGGKYAHLIGQVHGWLRGAPPLSKSTVSEKIKRLHRLVPNT